MLGEQDGKTEQATPKRKSDAKKKGQIPKSQDLSSAISFAIFAYLLVQVLTFTLEYAFVFFQNYFSAGIDITNIDNELSSLGINIIIMFFILVAPALILAFASAYLGNLIQVGFVFITESIKPTFDKMNPINNIKNIFGKQALFGLLKNLIKLGVIVYIVYSSAPEYLVPIMNLSNVGTEHIFYVVVEMTADIGTQIALFLVVLGIADYAFQRFQFNNSLKMSKQEIKDEYKESEGDPQMKQQRKQRHQEMINGNINDVKDATVIITNPTHLAIAIRYDKDSETNDIPVVVVKGADLMAQKMKEIAKEEDVPIVENVPVARQLYKEVDVGNPIPVDLYQAVAEILALIFQLEESKKHKI